MKILLRSLSALLLGLVLLETASFASGTNVDRQFDLINHAVHLTSDQRGPVIQLLRSQHDALLDATSDPQRGAINQATRASIRALLTESQKVIWDATPQAQGGGMGRQSSNDLTAGLRRAFDLSSSQLDAAARIFQAERVEVAKLPDGARKGSPAYRQIVQDTGHQIRALLRPDDQQAFDSVGDIVSYDLPERLKIVRALKGSARLAGAVGGIQSVKLKGGSIGAVSNDNGQTTLSGGTYNATVVGASKSTDLVIKFSGKAFSSDLNLEVTDSAGAPVPL